MQHATRRVVDVHVLTAGAAGPHELELQLRVENFEVGVVGELRQDGHAAGAAEKNHQWDDLFIFILMKNFIMMCFFIDWFVRF